MDAIAGVEPSPLGYEPSVPPLHYLAFDNQILFRVGAMVWTKDTIYQERVLSSFEATACLATTVLTTLFILMWLEQPFVFDS